MKNTNTIEKEIIIKDTYLLYGLMDYDRLIEELNAKIQKLIEARKEFYKELLTNDFNRM